MEKKSESTSFLKILLPDLFSSFPPFLQVFSIHPLYPDFENAIPHL